MCIFFTSLVGTSVISIVNTAASLDRPLIALPHPSGEMMVLDGMRALGVRLRDERGEEGR